MHIKGVKDEDFVNYKVPSMMISAASCSFKCELECGREVCQNSELAKAKTIVISDDKLIRRYLDNPITHAIVFGGLEPLDQLPELHEFLKKLREKYHCDDTVVIYTGYKMEEVMLSMLAMMPLGNIIVKFGRFIPDQDKHFDEILGVELASPNQYAVKIC